MTMRVPFNISSRKHIGVELLSAYLDRQTTAEEAARVEAHLAVCPACRAELESLRQTVALLGALPRVPVPRAFTLSEARLRRGRSVAAPAGWVTGWVRGLAAVTAVVLVAVVAAALFNRPTWSPAATSLARITPTPAVASALRAPEAPAAAPMPTATVLVTRIVEKAAELIGPTPLPTHAPRLEQRGAAAMPSFTPVPAPHDVTASTRPAPVTVVPTPTMAARAPAAAPVSSATAVLAPTATAEKGILSLAPPPPTSEQPDMRATGIGSGPALAPALPPAASLTPESLPPIAAITATLPPDTGIVYADDKGLWVLDSVAGVRQLTAGEGISMPLISPDRRWVLYRRSVKDYFELRLINWEGGADRLLLSERELPTDGLGKEFSERRLQEVRWIPGRPAAVALKTVAMPAAPPTSPYADLWRLDLDTGVLHPIVRLGVADLYVFAPDGSRLAVVRYGSEKQTRISLALYAADGSAERVLLGQPTNSHFDASLQWLPDSATLWAALPAEDRDDVTRINGLNLYRLTAAGDVKRVGQLEAFDAFWSADGRRLAFTRALGGSVETRELYLAEADGAQPQRYASLVGGMFLGWSADGSRFLYGDAGQVYVGKAGAAALRLGHIAGTLAPRWLTPEHIIYLQDTGSGWLLVLRPLERSPIGLQVVPYRTTWDTTAP